MSMAVAAVLKRGDFFGLTPAPPTTSQVSERGTSTHNVCCRLSIVDDYDSVANVYEAQ